MTIRPIFLLLVMISGGTAAAQDVNSLIADLKDEDLSLDTRFAVVGRLAELGPAAAPAIPAVNALATRALDPKRGSTSHIMFAINFYQQVGVEGVPQLISLANRTSYDTAALYALSQMGKDAESAVPQLLAMIKPQSQNEKTSHRCIGAMRALAEIDPENKEFHESLETYLKKYADLRRPGAPIPNWASSIARQSLLSVQQLGPAAKNLVPAVMALVEKEDLYRKEYVPDRLLYPAIDALAGVGPDAKDSLELLRRIKAKGIPGDDTRFEKVIAAIKAPPGTQPRVNVSQPSPFNPFH